MNKFWKVVSAIFAVGLIIIFCSNTQKSTLTITTITGEIAFTDKYNPDARICIPAAYTGVDGEIEGEYRINGVTHGKKSRSERISIHPKKGLVISKEWQYNNGFQQHVLIKDGKVRKFKDDRRFRRRALCCDASDPGKLFIIESNKRMTMNDFANEISQHCTTAVNLDMGRWGYGWIDNKTLSLWAYVFKDWQTNWLCCE